MNQPSDHFATYEFLDLSLPSIPPRSLLYPIEPQGIGTAYVESLTSYMVRLAQAHSVSVRSLIVGALAPLLKRRTVGYFDSRGKHLSGFLKDCSQSLSGTGRLAQDFVQAIEALTLRTDLAVLSLLHLVNITTAVSLQKTRKAWCPECFSEWRSTRVPVYEPLLWRISAVAACYHHRRPLINQCPHEDCQSTMQILAGTETEIGYCINCSRWLGVEAISQEIRPQEIEELNWNIGVSEMVGELFEHTLTLKEVAHLNNLPILIDAYLEQVAHDNKHEMEENVRISRAALTSWQRMRRVPKFSSLLRLCVCSGVSLLTLVTLPQGTFQSSVEIKVHPLPESVRQMPKAYKANPYDLNKLRQQLEEMLESKKRPPHSMRAVGRLLGRDSGSIRTYFPDLCKAISLKYLDFDKKEAKKRHQLKRKKVGKAIVELDAKGIYPSYKKVVAHLGKDFSLDFQMFSKYWQEGIAELKSPKT